MRTSLLAFAMAAAMLAGCRNNTSTPSTASPRNAAVSAPNTPALSPEQLGELGASIHKHPSDGTKILSDHGMTEVQFERAIRQVSSDPAASKRYAAAYKRNT